MLVVFGVLSSSLSQCYHWVMSPATLVLVTMNILIILKVFQSHTYHTSQIIHGSEVLQAQYVKVDFSSSLHLLLPPFVVLSMKFYKDIFPKILHSAEILIFYNFIYKNTLQNLLIYSPTLSTR